MTPLQPATIAFDERGIPFSPRHGDVYHSASGGLAQARHVFLAGNDLPHAWQQRERFVILETGFGLGLNFLAAWQAWREDDHRCAQLHVVSVEKHPFSRDDLDALHRHCLRDAPELLALAQQLQAQWPLLLPGVHRLSLDGGRVVLTLLFGDAAQQLRKLSLQADALFLDGFAPAKNPELWDAHFLKGVTRLCRPGATLATWTVAAAVRNALAAQRWHLDKAPGFGTKRDMLRGRLHGNVVPKEQPRRAIVIGAGLAGASIAERLAARGWSVTVLEREADIACGASGNPVGLLHPMLARDDNLAARLSRAGYLHALRLLEQLDREASGVRWQRCGILQLARDAMQEAAQRETIAALQFPAAYAAFVARAQAANMARHAVAAGGWWYPDGAIVAPPSLCRALLQRHGDAIDVRTAVAVETLERDEAGWRVVDQHGRVHAAPVVVLANADDAPRLLPQHNLPLTRMRGQISVLPRGMLPFLRHVVCGNGYVTPDTLGVHALGATFDMNDEDLSVRTDSHRFNLERLAELLPGIDTSRFDAMTLEGRAGFRSIALDRMPIVGALPDASQPLKNGARFRDVPRLRGLHAVLALGSRGLCWAPLAAELLAAQIEGEPLPLERDLIEAIDPARFAIRAQRRAVQERDL